MRNFSFVAQSGTTLDAPSMKSVRSHVTREQMKKRRSQLEQQNQGQTQGKPESRKPRANMSKARKKAKEKKNEDEEDNVEDIERASGQLPSPTTSESSQVVINGPSAQLSGTAAEFLMMPFDRTRLMNFFNRYYEFVGLYSVTDVGLQHEYSPFAGFLQRESYSNPAWLTSISLLSVLKLDIYRDTPNPDLLKYKAEALQSLNKKIKDSNPDMPTILAIAALFCFEVLHDTGTAEGEAAVMAHYHGILAYIQSQGGPFKMVEAHPAYGVFTIRATLTYEMVFALKKARDPRSVIVGIPKLRTFLPAPDGTHEPYFVGGPLLWPSSKTGHGSPEALAAVDGHELFTTDMKSMLFDLFTATELLYMEYHSEMEDDSKSTLSVLRTTITLPPPPDTSLGLVERRVWATARMARSCWLAAKIYIRAITELVPFTDPGNAEAVTELHKISKHLDVQSWSTLPYIHLWVALVGVGASVDEEQRRFFSVQIGRCGILFGSRWWNNYRQVVLNFLWLQKVLRKEVTSDGMIRPQPLSAADGKDLKVNIDVPIELRLDQLPLSPPASARDTLSPDIIYGDPHT